MSMRPICPLEVVHLQVSRVGNEAIPWANVAAKDLFAMKVLHSFYQLSRPLQLIAKPILPRRKSHNVPLAAF